MPGILSFTCYNLLVRITSEGLFNFLNFSFPVLFQFGLSLVILSSMIFIISLCLWFQTYLKDFFLISFHVIEYIHDGFLKIFFYFNYIEFLNPTGVGLQSAGEDILS